jgi:hypothetical protein
MTIGPRHWLPPNPRLQRRASSAGSGLRVVPDPDGPSGNPARGALLGAAVPVRIRVLQGIDASLALAGSQREHLPSACNGGPIAAEALGSRG